MIRNSSPHQTKENILHRAEPGTRGTFYMWHCMPCMTLSPLFILKGPIRLAIQPFINNLDFCVKLRFHDTSPYYLFQCGRKSSDAEVNKTGRCRMKVGDGEANKVEDES